MRLSSLQIFALSVMAAIAGCDAQTAGVTTEKSDAVVEETIGDVATPRAMAIEELIGVWDVALHFDPASPPSATVMQIDEIADGALAGSFYDSPFEEGRATMFRGEAIISVVTSDSSGRYLTSGRLNADGAFSGQTFSVGREFLMPWTATRRPSASE